LTIGVLRSVQIPLRCAPCRCLRSGQQSGGGSRVSISKPIGLPSGIPSSVGVGKSGRCSRIGRRGRRGLLRIRPGSHPCCDLVVEHRKFHDPQSWKQKRQAAGGTHENQSSEFHDRSVRGKVETALGRFQIGLEDSDFRVYRDRLGRARAICPCGKPVVLGRMLRP